MYHLIPNIFCKRISELDNLSLTADLLDTGNISYLIFTMILVEIHIVRKPNLPTLAVAG